MNSLRRSLWRFELLALVVALQGVLLSGSNVVPSQGAVNEATFANVTQPIGLAASPNQLLVTHPLCETEGLSREVLLIGSDGSTSTFATLPSREGCGEDHIVIATPFPNTPFTTPSEGPPPFPSQNPAGFTSGDKFVTQGANVYRIRWNATIPYTVTGADSFGTGNETCQLSSPTFDTVNTFGYKLIVVFSKCDGDGQVVVFNSSGSIANTITLPSATVGNEVEGPVVAPSSFGKFAGQLLITAENVPTCETECSPGTVFAVCPPSTADASCPNGQRINQVALVPRAEDAKIVPTTTCTYGLSNGATYFTAISGGTQNTVDQLPRSAFTGEGGNALVPSANNPGGAGITRLTPTSGGVTTSTFRAFFAQHQGSAFTDCGIPVLVQTTLNTPTGFVPRLLASIPGRSVSGDGPLLSPLLAQAIKADNNNNNNNNNNDKFFSVTWLPDPNFDPTLIRTKTVRLFINGKVLRPAFCKGAREEDEHDREKRTPQAVTCFFRLEDVSNPSGPYKIVAIYRDPGRGGDPECEGGGG